MMSMKNNQTQNTQKTPNSEYKAYVFPEGDVAKMASELSLNGTEFSCRLAYK